MNVDMEEVFRVNLVPKGRGHEKSVSPVSTDLCTDVCKVGSGVGY